MQDFWAVGTDQPNSISIMLKMKNKTFIHLPLTFQVSAKSCFPSASWPSRLFSSAWGIFVIFIQFIVPLFILIFCYGRILFVLTRRIDSRNNSSNNLKINNNFLLARANTIKTFLMVGIFFFICWVNDEVYYLMYNLGYDADWNGIYFKFCVIMMFLNCTVNPFIYLIKYQDYQLALKMFLGCSCKNHKSRENVGHMCTVDATTSYTS